MTGDVYARITDRVLELLEAGVVPWRKPWRGGAGGQPRNLASGRPYRGINVFLLACTPYESPWWLTYRQAVALKGHIRRGEKSTPVVFWKWIEKENPETGQTERFPLLRHYNIFNSEQCELPPGTVPAESDVVPTTDFEPIAVCEQIVAGMPSPPTIRHGGGTAFYRPSEDVVMVPESSRFERAEEYYATLFHELVHSTGHPARLDRPGVAEAAVFGSPTYSKEELVAEMGAAFLCGHCGIENATLDNSAAYLRGWLRKLRDDRRLVVHAAGAAQKAADYVLGQSVDESEADSEPASSGAVVAE